METLGVRNGGSPDGYHGPGQVYAESTNMCSCVHAPNSESMKDVSNHL